MKRTIDYVLRSCEQSIELLQIFAEECTDTVYRTDIWTYHALVFHHQSLIRIHYHHWCSEFTPAQCDRMRRLLTFDVAKFVKDWFDKWSFFDKQAYSDEIPF